MWEWMNDFRWNNIVIACSDTIGNDQFGNSILPRELFRSRIRYNTYLAINSQHVAIYPYMTTSEWVTNIFNTGRRWVFNEIQVNVKISMLFIMHPKSKSTLFILILDMMRYNQMRRTTFFGKRKICHFHLFWCNIYTFLFQEIWDEGW